MLDRLTNIVREMPENDPHEGTDLEAPKREPKEAGEEKPEESNPEQQAEEQTEEWDEETPVFEIDVKTGKGEKETRKLSLKDLREGYLAKEDYHRNIQAVKKQEAELNDKLNKASLETQQQYAQQLEIYRQAVLRTIAPELNGVDLNKLAQEDPAEAQRIFFKQIEVNKALQAIQDEQSKAVSKAKEEFDKAQKQAAGQAWDTLAADVKGWNEDTYKNLMNFVSSEYGYKSEEVANWVDARAFKLAHDAFQYRQLQKAKPEIAKKVVAVPKVVKPGAAQKANPGAEAVEKARDSLRKTGNGRAFVDWYLAKNKK